MLCREYGIDRIEGLTMVYEVDSLELANSG